MRRAWAEAAIASRWPTLHVFVADEAAAERAEATLEAVFGSLPQGEILEPADDGPWELRVDLPTLDLDGLDAVERAFALADLPAPLVVPGDPPGRRAAIDTGALFAEVIAVEGVEARQWLLSDGQPAPLDLVRRAGADAEVLALERELAEALRAVRADLVFETDRGPDTVDPIVHRTSGRFGVLATLGRDTLERFEDVDALREAVVAALAGVVRARIDHARLRLAPDLLRDERWGWSFGLFFSAWAVEPFPGDCPVTSGSTPRGEIVDPAFAGLFDAIEIQVVPRDPAEHVAIAIAAAEVAATVQVAPGPPRWVRAPGWVLAPTWRCAAERIGEVLAPFARLPVHGVRAVPADPIGLEALGDGIDAAWHTGELRWIGRLHDGRTDRDLAPRLAGRAPVARDERLMDQLGRLAAIYPSAAEAFGPMRAVGDAAGRRAIEIRLSPAGAHREVTLRAAMDVVGLVDVPGLADVALLAVRPEGPHLWVFWDEPVSAPPAWGLEAPAT